MSRDLTYNGRTLSVAEWAKVSGIPYKTIHARVNDLGWSDAEAVTVKTDVKTLTHDGRTQTLGQWAREVGLPAVLLHGRLGMGWPADKILTMPRTARGAKAVAPLLRSFGRFLCTTVEDGLTVHHYKNAKVTMSGQAAKGEE